MRESYIAWTWCQSGEFVLECEKRLSTVAAEFVDLQLSSVFLETAN